MRRVCKILKDSKNENEFVTVNNTLKQIFQELKSEEAATDGSPVSLHNDNAILVC